MLYIHVNISFAANRKHCNIPKTVRIGIREAGTAAKHFQWSVLELTKDGIIQHGTIQL